MTGWTVWLIAAGILIAAEIFTGTFYLLMIAIGCGAGALAAMADLSFYMQCVVAGATGGIVTVILRHSKVFRKHRPEAQRNPSVHLDIGQSVDIVQWDKAADGVCRSRVQYRGAFWDVELLPSGTPTAGAFIIREIRGATLLVENRPA